MDIHDVFSASSACLLNGTPGAQIWHCRVLGQGDPLSPLLFSLAIDQLHRLLAVATEQGSLALFLEGDQA